MVSLTFGAANLAGRRHGGEASGDDAVELGSGIDPQVCLVHHHFGLCRFGDPLREINVD